MGYPVAPRALRGSIAFIQHVYVYVYVYWAGLGWALYVGSMDLHGDFWLQEVQNSTG